MVCETYAVLKEESLLKACGQDTAAASLGFFWKKLGLWPVWQGSQCQDRCRGRSTLLARPASITEPWRVYVPLILPTCGIITIVVVVVTKSHRVPMRALTSEASWAESGLCRCSPGPLTATHKGTLGKRRHLAISRWHTAILPPRQISAFLQSPEEPLSPNWQGGELSLVLNFPGPCCLCSGLKPHLGLQPGQTSPSSPVPV